MRPSPNIALLSLIASLLAAAEVPRVTVEAVVTAASGGLKAQDVLPYRHALTLYAYQVEKVVAGSLAAKRIAVAHWTFIDQAEVPPRAKLGDRLTLTLEAFDARPGLKDLKLRNDLDGSYDLPWFLDVGQPGLPPLGEAAKPLASVPVPAAVRAAAAQPATPAEQQARIAAIAAAKQAIAAELTENGGTWEAWNAGLGAFRADIGKTHKSQKYERGDFFFSGMGIVAISKGDYVAQKEAINNPLPMFVALHRQLAARGIDLIVMPIPNKEDVYPDKLSTAAPASFSVSPGSKHLLDRLLAEGIEVIDLFALYRAHRLAKGADIYQPYDSHWNHAGALIAANAIAQRLGRYGFVAAAKAQPPLWRTREAKAPGGTDALLKENPRKPELAQKFPVAFRAITSAAGDPYLDAPDSPVLITGDSFARHLLVEGGGLSAQVAFAINAPCSLLAGPGSGPQIMRLIEQQGPTYLAGRRVVVWTAVARSFSKSEWPVIDLPK